MAKRAKKVASKRKAVTPTPEYLHALTAHLVFKVMHAEIRIGGSVPFMADAAVAQRGQPGPAVTIASTALA